MSNNEVGPIYIYILGGGGGGHLFVTVERCQYRETRVCDVYRNTPGSLMRTYHSYGKHIHISLAL